MKHNEHVESLALDAAKESFGFELAETSRRLHRKLTRIAEEIMREAEEARAELESLVRPEDLEAVLALGRAKWAELQKADEGLIELQAIAEASYDEIFDEDGNRRPAAEPVAEPAEPALAAPKKTGGRKAAKR